MEGVGKNIHDVHGGFHPQLRGKSRVQHAAVIAAISGVGFAIDACAYFDPGDARIVVITLGEGLNEFLILFQKIGIPITRNRPVHGVAAHDAVLILPDHPGGDGAAAAAAPVVDGKSDVGGFAEAGLRIEPFVHYCPVKVLVADLDVPPAESHISAGEKGIIPGADVAIIQKNIDARIGGDGALGSPRAL